MPITQNSGQRSSVSDEGDTTSLNDEHEQSMVINGDRIPVAFVQRLRRRKMLACAAILFTVFAERVAFYALAGNLYLFLNHHPLAWTSQDAMMALLVFTGTTFVGAFCTGYLGDACGRFKIILVSLLVYILGLVAFVTIAQYQNSDGGDFIGLCRITDNNQSTVTRKHLFNLSDQDDVWLAPLSENEYVENTAYTFHAADTPAVNAQVEHHGAQMQCGTTIYALLVIIGLASSGIKANIVPFGAEQVKQESRTAVRSYFTIYYWVVNLAAFLSILVLAYIQQSTAGGFGLGYVIPTVVLVISVILFWVAHSLYVRENPEHPVLYSIIQVMIEAWQQNRVMGGRRGLAGRQWLDAAKIEFGGRFDNELVEDVKQLKFVVGVFALLIPYWVLYFQMQTSFQEQGLHMRLLPTSMLQPINSKQEFTIPTAWLTLFNVIFVILSVPIFERCVYPQLERRQRSPSTSLRILVGLICAAAAMLCAGGVEVHRLQLVRNNETIIQVIDGTEYVAADMWVFWQIPAYSFVGLSEILASISAVELAYSHAPVSMQGVVMGLFYLSTGLGCFFGSFLLSIVSPYWLAGNSPNSSRLDNYLGLLAAIEGGSAIVFYFCVVRGSGSRPLRSTYA